MQRYKRFPARTPEFHGDNRIHRLPCSCSS
nr:MAG TPA: hypothetical protein [Caudoviricetes sp.]